MTTITLHGLGGKALSFVNLDFIKMYIDITAPQNQPPQNLTLPLPKKLAVPPMFPFSVALYGRHYVNFVHC